MNLMSVRILWRSAVFLLTLALIYLAFPILIVPSSLPAIKSMLIANEYPENFKPQSNVTDSAADTQIYQLTFPKVPTAKDKLQLIKDLHRQGMNLILNRASPESR